MKKSFELRRKVQRTSQYRKKQRRTVANFETINIELPLVYPYLTFTVASEGEVVGVKREGSGSEGSRSECREEYMREIAVGEISVW